MAILPTTTGINTLAATPLTGNRMVNGGDPSSWFEALASAWGQTLDEQAAQIEQMSDALDQGGDNPSSITKLTAESLRMTFLANSSSTSIDSVAKALDTMARKG
jgi:hypothetical protein